MEARDERRVPRRRTSLLAASDLVEQFRKVERVEGDRRIVELESRLGTCVHGRHTAGVPRHVFAAVGERLLARGFSTATPIRETFWDVTTTLKSSPVRVKLTPDFKLAEVIVKELRWSQTTTADEDGLTTVRTSLSVEQPVIVSEANIMGNTIRTISGESEGWVRHKVRRTLFDTSHPHIRVDMTVVQQGADVRKCQAAPQVFEIEIEMTFDRSTPEMDVEKAQMFLDTVDLIAQIVETA